MPTSRDFRPTEVAQVVAKAKGRGWIVKPWGVRIGGWSPPNHLSPYMP